MNDKVESRRPKLLCICASILFLVYACSLAVKSVAGFAHTAATHEHWPWLGDRPVGEDGFYMLTVADNLAVTGHLVYNQNMPTTGIQPLSTLVFAGVAYAVHHAGGERWTLIRAIIVLESCLFLVFAWRMASFASRLAGPPLRPLVFDLAFFLVLFDFTLFRLFNYALETGVYLCALSGCIILWHRLIVRRKASWGNLLLFGVLAGIAGLARIDFGLVFVILLGDLLYKKRISLLQGLIMGLTALVIVSPWFFFVHGVGGTWLPSSGSAESRLLTLHDGTRVWWMACAIAAHLVPWSFADSEKLPPYVVLLASLLFLSYLWRTRKKALPAGSSSVVRATLLPWIVAVSILTFVYLALFWSFHFYSRYTAPVLLFSVPLLALFLAQQSFVQRRSRVVLAALILLFLSWDLPYLHRGRVGSSMFLSAGYIADNYPDAHVGAFQSGTIGYFDPNVENLDGKVNTVALRAAQGHRLGAFIDQEGIDLLIDRRTCVDTLPQEYRAKNWTYCPNPMPAVEDVCLMRKRGSTAGSTSEAAADPQMMENYC